MYMMCIYITRKWTWQQLALWSPTLVVKLLILLSNFLTMKLLWWSHTRIGQKNKRDSQTFPIRGEKLVNTFRNKALKLSLTFKC